MEKSDEQIHKICVRNITKSLMEDANLKYTQIFKKIEEVNIDEVILATEEIPICSTILDKHNWSLLTTQRLITKKEGTILETDIETANNLKYGDFKGYQDKEITMGKVETSDGEELEYFIETGKTSMVMVQGVKTRIQIQNRI
ncbi:hypothetical protein [Reichenbachiella sp.]|uniref:hypothetical protein n=1 Tax=Reichenbachiella sp. TaxID=2184521 RepID=UPI003298CD0F